MSERTKKILFAIFFVSFTLGMGYVLYLMYTRSIIGPAQNIEQPGEQQPTDQGAGTLPQAGTSTTRPTDQGGTTGNGTLPNAGTLPGETGGTTGSGSSPEAGTILLRDSVTQDISMAPDSNAGARFYDPNDGRFYRLNEDGTTTVLDQKQFFNVQDVAWGNRTDEAVIEFPDGSNVYYDFAQQKQVPLPKHWEDFHFSDDDSHMVAKSVGTDPENRFLIVANPDGTEAKAIGSLGENQDLVKPAWAPNGQIVAYAMTGQPQSDGRQEIYLIGQNKENYRSLVVPGQGFTPNWSPSGSNLLYSTWNEDTNDKPTLWVTSGEAGTIGNNRRKLNLNTWADMCVWASDANLYCAVPRDLPDYAGLDRKSFDNLPADVYNINLRTNLSHRISTDKQFRPMRNLVVSGDGSKLMFTDAVSGKLYSYDLPK